MSQVHTVIVEGHPDTSRKPLWPVAAVILLVVFAPAAIAWAIMAIRP